MACLELSGERAATPRAAAARPALGLLVVAMCAWWAVAEGGAAPTVWYPGALVLLAALVAALRPGRLHRLPPAGRVALAALAAYAAWSLLSITWADARGDAWDGANRTLLYLIVFALFALLPWTPAQATLVLAAFVLATAVVGVWALAAAIGGDPDAFADGRLAGPVGYENASAALLLGAFWPALLLAARRATRPARRGSLLAVAGLLLGLAVLAQSRASLIGGAAALLLALWLTRERLRLAIALGAVALTTAASLPVLLAVYTSAPDSHDALVRAALALGLSATVLLIAGIASGPFDRRRALVPPRRLGLVAVGACVIAAAGGGSAGLSSRFAGGAESGRYDLWRVAARQFARHPVLGAGADNFAHDYARDGRRHQELLYPHSVEWRALGQTGLVGGLLLGGFLAAAFAVLAALRGDAARWTPAVAALVMAAYWLVHASFDWLWELPAVTAPAMACFGLATGLALRPAAEPARGRSVLVAAPAVAVALSLALPALASRAVERAARSWDRDPAGALRTLDAARRLNPLSDRPDLVAGALASATGDTGTARSRYARAVARDPHNWQALAELGVLEVAAGQRRAGLARLRHARELAPREPAIAAALAAASSGAAVPRDVGERLVALAIPSPLGRRPVGCQPVLGLAPACTRGAEG
jgi:O-Antigen ligase